MKRLELWLWSALVGILLALLVVAKAKDLRAQDQVIKERMELQARQQQWQSGVEASKTFVLEHIEEFQKRENQLKDKQRKVKAKPTQLRRIQSELRVVTATLLQLKATKWQLDHMKTPIHFVQVQGCFGMEWQPG